MVSPTSATPRGTLRGPVAAMVAVAISLVIASALHLSGNVSGRGFPYNAQHAGVAEALISVVLLVCAAVMLRWPARARLAGLIGTGFATFGFLWGLNMTIRGGHWPDIVYHLVFLPVLVGALVVLVRSRGGNPR